MPSSLTWLKPPSRALVVGINEYDDPYISDLRGCVGDAREVATFLREAGMLSAHIRLLTSPPEGEGEQRATRAAIVAGIREFLGSTPSGEEALLYYSGHGSTTLLDPALQTAKRLGEPVAHTDEEVRKGVEEAKKNEAKGLGETFVPADARVGGVLELLDLELRYLLAELVAKGIRVTLIADSCYAGGIVRSDKDEVPDPTIPVARLTGRDRVKRTLASLLEGAISQEKLDRLVEENLPLALIAGSLPSQQSFERTREDGAIRGVMTSTLLEILRSANGPLSYRELGRALRSRVVSGRDAQRQYPHINSTWNRYLFSDEEENRTRPLFVVQELTETGIRLDGGEVEGVEVGSELTCFADWTLSQPHGRWRVTQTTASSADAVPLEGALPPRPGQPLQLEHVPSRPTLYFHPSATHVGNGWRNRESGSLPFLVEVYRAPADYIVQAEGDRWVTRRRNGEEVAPLSLPRNVRSHTDIALRLDQVACYERFIAQQSPVENALPRSSEGYVGGVELKVAQVDLRGTLSALVAGAEVVSLTKGARVAITVHNHSADKRYVYVYRLDPERYVAQRVWPTDATAELQWDQANTTYWEDRKWEGGLLRFKLIVSSEPLEMEIWPCGQAANWRGGSKETLRVLAEREQGRGIADIEVGKPPV